MTRPVIASEVARYAGEIVAVVLTEDRLHGPDAAERVHGRLEELPVTADAHSALADETLLFPDVGRTSARGSRTRTRTRTLFDGCDVVATTRSQPAARLVPDGVPRRPPRRGARRPPHTWMSTQTPNGTRDALDDARARA